MQFFCRITTNELTVGTDVAAQAEEASWTHEHLDQALSLLITQRCSQVAVVLRQMTVAFVYWQAVNRKRCQALWWQQPVVTRHINLGTLEKHGSSFIGHLTHSRVRVGSRAPAKKMAAVTSKQQFSDPCHYCEC